MDAIILSNRKQAIKSGHCISDLQVKCHIFADTTCIFHSNKNKQTLQNNLDSSLENITNYHKTNKLTWNVKKLNLITFNISKNQKDEKMDMFLDGEKLEAKDHAKYLGVFTDRNLAWN